MLKSNSLINRILALALTLVMILGMMPSGIVSAEEATGTTIYFDPLDEWVAAGYNYVLHYAVGAGNHTYLDLTDSDGDGIYEVAVGNDIIEMCMLNFRVYESGKTGMNYLYYHFFDQVENGSKNLFTATGLDAKYQIEIEGEWSVYTPGSVMPPEQTGVTIYFDPLDEWVAAGYTYALDYCPTQIINEFFPMTDTDGDGIYEVTVTAEVAELYQTKLWTSVHVYADGQSKWNDTYMINPPRPMPTDGRTMIRPVGEPDDGGWYDGEWVPFEAGSVTPPVPEVTYAAQVGDNQYESLEAAIAAAQSGDILTLLSDVTAAGPITIDKDITLNLNGFTLTLPEHSNYAIVVKGSLTVNGEGNVVVEGLYGIGLSTSCTGGLTVNGGNFIGANADYLIGAFNGKVTINGGTFTSNYCVVNNFEGYKGVLELNGGTLAADYPVLGAISGDNKATLIIGEFLCTANGAYYHDLAAAVAAVESGATIYVLADGEGPGFVVNKNVKIDFQGHTYSFTEGVGSTGTESNGIQVLAGSNLYLCRGVLNVVAESADKFYILIQNYGDLYVSEMTLDGTNLDKWSATDGDSYTLSNNSGDVLIENSTIIANDEGALAYAFDVCQYQSYAAPTVTFKSGTVKGAVDVSSIGNSTFVIEGGQFKDNSLIDYVVYGKTMDETGKVIIDTIIDSERELRDAIAKGGEVSLGGNIALTAPITINGDVTLNLNGYTLTLPAHSNYAIVVKGSLTINGDGNVVMKGLYGIGLSTTCTGGLTINGGNFTGNGDYMIGAYNGNVTINGGTFTNDYCIVNSFDGYNATVQIIGGTFTADYPVLGTSVSIVEGAQLNIGEFLCYIGNDFYCDMAEAVAAAKSDATITLMSNGKGSGFVVDKDLFIDFRGYTYSFTEGVGSTGTESNGIQVLAGNSLILTRGELNIAAESADKFYILIQNYGNLTMDQMTLDGTNLDKWSATDGDSYTLSINSGTVLSARTKIIANNDGDLAFAFDVCQYGSYPVANVTMMDAEITGKVDLSAFGESKLTIDGGVFNGDIDVSKLTADSNFTIKNGTFSNDISDFVIEGKAAVYENGKYIVRLAQNGFSVEAAPQQLVYTEGLTHQIVASGNDTDAPITFAVTEGNATVTADGLVTIKGVGDVKITVSKAGNETYAPATYEYAFTVVKGVSSITIDKTHVDLTFGVDSFQMPATFVGDGEVTYTITETNVAVTLNSTTGELTFDDSVDQVGSFKVTISKTEGANYEAAEDVSYTVTVSYAEMPEVPFTLSPEKPNDLGWYNESVYLAPAEGYQFCLQVDGTVSTWRANGIEYTDGVYENVVIYLKNAEGGITAPITVGTLKIDSVKPAVTMEIVNAVWKTITEKIFFITNEDVTVKVTVSDATSEVADVQISLNSGESFNTLGNKAGEYLVTLNAEFRDAIEVVVVDNSGLENSVKSEGTIVIDASDPLIKAEFAGDDVTSMDVVFTDGVDFSVKYTVTENNLDLHDKNLVVTVNGEVQNGWTLSEDGVVEKAFTEDGVYEIIATFTDIANNTPATVTKNFVIDTAAPTITLNPGEATDILGVYYTSETTYGVVITINEELYGTYLKHGVKPVVTVNGEVETLNWATNTATVNLPANGVYDVVVTYDNLVHEPVTANISVVVDADKPAITLTPNTELDVDGIYYTSKENYGLAISLNEDLYSYYYELGFKPAVTVNGTAVDLDWSKPEATLNLPENGVYQVVVSYSNCWKQAENETVTIVVDHEVPVITLTPDIELIENGVYYTAKEGYGLTISLNEDLYDYYLSCGLKPVVTVNGTAVELDWSKNETVLTLAENGVYEVVVNYENYLHKAETQSITIVVDHEKPVITLTPDIVLFENGVYYTAKEGYELKISLNEDLYSHYLACGIEPVVTVNGKETKLDWTSTETVLALPDNGVYEIVVNYSNYLHQAVTETVKIVVDHEVPVIDLLHGIEDPDLLVDGTYYTDDEKYELTIHLTEDLYDYYLSCGIAPVVTVNGVETTLEWNHVKGDDALLKAILPLETDGVYEIVVNYGHYLHTAETKSITICKDTVDPEVTITYRDAEGKDVTSEIINHVGETVFADAVTAVITVKDVNFDKRDQFVDLKVTPANAVAETRTYTASWTEVSEDVWECLLVLDVAADYVIEFACQDYANNANSASATLAVDINEVPDNFKFGYSTSVHGEVLENLTLGFWKNQVTVTVDVVDDISGVEFFTAAYSVAEDAYQNGNFAGAFEREELKVLTSEQITNGYRVTFLVPKDILSKDNQVNGYITVTATDYAGNSTTVTDGVQVIVDNIDPTRTVELTAPVNETETVKYYDGTITLRANIFEANYRFYNDAVVSIVKDGVAYNLNGHVTGWMKGEANATNTITLTEDGDYVVTITYTDGSGNKMADYSSGKLTLDTIAPVITVSNIKQNSANKDDSYGFTITVSDINLDVPTVEAKLTAVVKGEDGKYTTKEISLGDAVVSADGTTVTYTVENLEEDALYTLVCSAEDMSNNLCSEIKLDDGETYETVNFSINRNGSTFGFGTDYMTELVNQYYVYSIYEDLVIVEVNVDPIENYTVTVNGKELVEGTDFTTEQTSSEGEWSKRTYVINKDLFAEEGEYNVIVSSTDKAETTAYSDIKDLAIAFVVDQTAPILTISGLQTGGRYQTDEQTVTLIPTDEGGRLNTLKVVVLDANGNPITDDDGNDISVRFDYSGEELLNYLAENGDMVSFTIPSGLEHQVKISCSDCAVNEDGVTNEYNGTFSRVTVSQNALVIFYANKSAFFGTLGGAAALIILIAVLLSKKKSAKK